MRYVLVMIR